MRQFTGSIHTQRATTIAWIGTATFIASVIGLLLSGSAPAFATVSAQDDTQRMVTLAAPASRIVSLAPHATELLFAAGAGAKVVGVSEYSDYPPQAKTIASVGGATSLDLERIIALKPDLIVIWGSGNSAQQLARLRTLSIPFFDSQPNNFETIATSLERLAHLAGTDAVGQLAARTFRLRVQKLEADYRQRPVVSVFYQIWRSPLMTLNDNHMVSKAIALCGGTNVFGKLPQLAPTISAEAVLSADPEAIITGSSAKHERLAEWRRFAQLTAVKRDNLISLDSDTMTRPSPRILEGTDALCRQLDLVRAKRK